MPSAPVDAPVDHLIHQVRLAIPPSWKDRSIHAFVLPSPSGAEDASFVVTRGEAAVDATIEDYTERCTAEVARRLPHFRLRERIQIIIDGKPATQVEYSWRTPEHIEVIQRQAHIHHDNQFVTFTLSTRAASAPAYEEAWQQVLATVHLQPPERS